MSFPELIFLEKLIEKIGLGDTARISELGKVSAGSEHFPLYSVCLGAKNPEAPTLALVGGVHGQEKIGSQVVLSYLETLSELMRWDEQTHELLQKVRIAFYPIANPVGMFLLQRGNGNRVDLMRNAPGDYPGTTFLLGGQRMSPYLPWYRGKAGAPMEVEAQALCDFVRKEVLPARTAITLDCHSGYGAADRLWFPYSHTSDPFPQLAETYALKCLLDRTYPNHVYLMEPGSAAYKIQGDLWDYLYNENLGKKNNSQFLPLTLEMGSWAWLKKNPVQLFSAMGFFQPMQLHRHKRVLRRHLTLLDFLLRAVMAPNAWMNLNPEDRNLCERTALEHWELKGAQ